ncbi:COX15/CtaA family protein [bacterium]|nr:COX15/CtaA family protein [bacterium]
MEFLNQTFVRRFAAVTAVATWFLLVAGALVTSTGSGLSVPDWPLSYGQWMPPMVGGVFFEHGHRMVAGTVALLTVFLAFAIAKTESRTWVRNMAFTAVGLVVVQATLGGLTVLLRLPPAVSVSHAFLGQSFFCLVAVLAFVLNDTSDAARLDPRPEERGLFWFSVCLTAGFLLQLFLGASVRHLHAGLSIPDFPTVYGGLLPPLWNAQIAFHFAHRITAYVLFAVTLVFVFRLVARERRDKQRVFLCVAWVGLLVLQVALGAITIWWQRPVAVTAAHLAVGALCLAASVLLSFRLGSMAGVLRGQVAQTRWETV